MDMKKAFEHPKKKIYRDYLKRPLDFLAAFMGLLLLSPLFLCVGILIRKRLGSPILFKQERIGINGDSFTIYKFRTMTDQKNEKGELLPDSLRLTKFGEFLRASSIDELPELLNVLRGEMSIVGPRPLPVLYKPYFTEEENRRHSVRGGITGLAQINGRGLLSWESKFKYDVEYTENITFAGDLGLILGTMEKTLRRKDIGVRGLDAPEDFNLYRIKQKQEGCRSHEH